MFKYIAYYFFRDEIWKYLFVMRQDMYAPIHVLYLDDQKTPATEKLFYFFLQTDHIITKWIKDT